VVAALDIRSSTSVEIDLAAIRHNIRAILDYVRSTGLVVVKANGYGHGIVPVGRCAVEAGARMLGVTSPGEAFQLRHEDVPAPILIMSPLSDDELSTVAETDFAIVVWTKEQIAKLSNAARERTRSVSVHIKVDIGMGRFGVLPGEATDLVALAASTPGIYVQGLMGHLPSSDVADTKITEAQIARFQRVVEELEERSLRPPIVHCANSAAAFRFGNAAFDMVRIGISAYGVNPCPCIPTPVRLKPTLRWKARIINLQIHKAGEEIGYGGEYRCSTQEVIATLGVGYADGFRRVPKNVNEVLIRGLKVRVVGRLCMQQCMVTLPDAIAQQVRLGEEAVLIGSQGDEEITVSEIAERWKTNEWDVFCGINPLITRRY
jgi:alanine racemase